jgi:hypothetical protein
MSSLGVGNRPQVLINADAHELKLSSKDLRRDTRTSLRGYQHVQTRGTYRIHDFALRR